MCAPPGDSTRPEIDPPGTAASDSGGADRSPLGCAQATGLCPPSAPQIIAPRSSTPTDSPSPSAVIPPEPQTDPSEGETSADPDPDPTEILSPGSPADGAPSAVLVATELQRRTTRFQ